MSIVKESSSETSKKIKKPNVFSLELSTKLFVVPSRGFLKNELKNVSRRTQEGLITLESAIFTIKNFKKELFPSEQLCMILNSSETKRFTICVKEHFPEPFIFDHIRLLSPEGHLIISHCDTRKKSNDENVELDESNELMCLAKENNEQLNWGSITQNMVLDLETEALKEQKERYYREKEDYDNKKANNGIEKKEEKLFNCCKIM